MQVTLLSPPTLFLHAIVLPSWDVWAQLLVEPSNILARKLIWAKNNFFAWFLIQISCLIYFTAEPALQMKELLLKVWLVTHPCWTTTAREGNMPCLQTFLPWVAAVASSTLSASPWQCVSGGGKSSAMVFQGMTSAAMEDGFYKNSRAYCSHTL